MKIKRLILLISLIILCLIISQACTHNQMAQIPSPPVRGADLYPQQQNKDDLIVAVDDYFDDEKSMEIFGVDLTKKNILALEVIISNRSNEVYSFRNDEIFLIQDGKITYPLPLTKLDFTKEMDGYYQFLGLQDILINPGDTKHGFIYFYLGEKNGRDDDKHFSIFWPTDYKLRLGITKISGQEQARLIYTLFLRNL